MNNQIDPATLLKQEKTRLLSENKSLINSYTLKHLKDSRGNLLPSIHEIKAVDGSTYIGNLEGNIKQGKGIYYYTNGDIYFGDWLNDSYHGTGSYIFKKGDRYDGELMNGVK